MTAFLKLLETQEVRAKYSTMSAWTQDNWYDMQTNRALSTFGLNRRARRMGGQKNLKRSWGPLSRSSAVSFYSHDNLSSQGSYIEHSLIKFSFAIVDRLPDPVKSSLVLYKYANMHDATFLKLISDCMDSRRPLKEIRKAAVGHRRGILLISVLCYWFQVLLVT
jgi:hypothetical protein